MLGKPGADDAAVGRKAGRFADAKPQAQEEQGFQPEGKTLQQSKQRPEENRQGIGELVTKTV